MTIPIRNLYYLLAYAWDLLEEAQVTEHATEQARTPQELLVRMLLAGTEHLLRRGIDRGYVEREEELRYLRGRILMARLAVKPPVPGRGVACEYDDLTHDVLQNRMLRRALGNSRFLAGLERETQDRAAALYHRLEGIGLARIEGRALRTLQFHRNNRFYRFLLDVAGLLETCSLPTQESGKVQVRDFTKDDQLMPALYERFVFNFLKREQDAYDVRRMAIEWALGPVTEPDRAVLPGMQTDITLVRDDETVIIDTKFYRDALRTHHGASRLHSANLYQMLAYLHNHSLRTAAPPGRVAGILLYPVTSHDFRHEYVLCGHRVTARSVNLTRPWEEIRGELLTLVAH